MNAGWLVRLLVWLLRRKSDGNAPPLTTQERESIRSVLLIRVDERMGNVLLTAPLAQALCQTFPEARIEWLVCRRYRWLVEEHPPSPERANLRIRPFEKRSPWIAPWYFFSLIFHLLRTPYDLVIDAAHEQRASFTSLALALLAGGRWRVGHRRGVADWAYTHAVATNAPDDADPTKEAHDAQRKLRLLKPVLGEVPSTPPWIASVPEKVKDDVREWLRKHDIDRQRLLGLYVGGRKPDHRWPVERFAEFLRAFGPPAGWRALIFWGPGEKSLARALEEKSEGRALAIPACDIAYLQSFLGICDLMVIGDTGPMHMSWALGVPTVAVFRCSDAMRWLPRVPQVVGVLPHDDLGPRPSDVEAAARWLARGIEEGNFVPPKEMQETCGENTPKNEEKSKGYEV